MCKFWSAILTREGKVLWDRNMSSHEELIRKNNLNDGELKNRGFVRIEITPKDITSKKKGDWSYKVDEPSTIPDWYQNDPLAQEKIVWKEWKMAMEETLWKLQLDKLQAIIDGIKAIKYLDCHGEVDPSWHLYYGKTWVAARVAAWDAAGDAAWDAAGDAAGVDARVAAGDAAGDAAGAPARYAAGAAAWDAAGDAARAAAWDVARAAAWDVARAAAGDAARAAQNQHLIEILGIEE